MDILALRDQNLQQIPRCTVISTQSFTLVILHSSQIHPNSRNIIPSPLLSPPLFLLHRLPYINSRLTPYYTLSPRH
jgi:hypothetical protein